MLRSMCQLCAMEFLEAVQNEPRNLCNYLTLLEISGIAQKSVTAHGSAPQQVF